MPIKEPVVIAREVLKDLQAIFGENLLSVALFGSAARGTYDPKRSDINLVIVLKGDVRPSLSSFWKYVSKWRKLDLAVPVVMNEQFLSSSLDTFAVEFSDMKESHIIIFGDDILSSLDIKKEHIRLQVERELKQKIMALSSLFINSLGKKNALYSIIKRSISSLATLFRASLIILDEKPPKDDSELSQLVCRRFGLDASIFEKLLAVRADKSLARKENLSDLISRYIDEMTKFSFEIDKLSI